MKELMATYNYETSDDQVEGYREFQRIVKTWIGCLGSFMLSMIGGLILTWWEFNYHPTNDQQWMVPLGLILFVTPLVVWLAVFVSDFCNVNLSTTHNNSPEKLFQDPEK